MNTDKIYLVKYCGGSYDDYYTCVVFATTKQSVAKKYVAKFNRILKKWKKYYRQFEGKEMGFNWIKQEHVEKHFDRWNAINNISEAYYEEIPVR